MDNVLDCFCIFHLLWNIHRHFFVVVPILLWAEGGDCDLAAVASHWGQLSAVSQFCAPDVDQTGKGKRIIRKLRVLHKTIYSKWSIYFYFAQEIDEYINQAKEKGCSAVIQLGSRGVNYATNVIMQTALKVSE